MKTFHSAFQSICQNRLRSILAGFGIAWGIFLLVVFLGIGGGFRDGVLNLFKTFAQKSLFIYGGRTSIPTSELNENTQVVFDRDIVKRIRHRYGCVVSCAVEMTSPFLNISRDGNTTSASIKGVGADYFNIRILRIKEGHGLTHMDEIESRNVVVIGEGINNILFGNQESIGHTVNIGGSLFRVIGILSSDNLFSIQERNSIYVPVTSFMKEFNSESNVSSFCLSLSSNANTTSFEDDIKGYLAHKYGFDKNDEQALYVSNIETQTEAFESLFNGIEILIWIVGVCLLLSGIVGVCNVMLIIVRERTSEIGIRKAVGASSGSIISLIMAESVTITFISGIVGILLGALVIFLINTLVLPTLHTDIMEDLQINMPVILAAFVILCISGIIAGLIPALKASQISPVDAIRHDFRG